MHTHMHTCHTSEVHKPNVLAMLVTCAASIRFVSRSHHSPMCCFSAPAGMCWRCACGPHELH